MNFGCLSLPTNDGQRFLRTIVSGDFPFVVSTAVTFSHGFDTLPLIRIYAVNIIAENGWIPGDQVLLQCDYVGANNAGNTIRYTANSVTINIGSTGAGGTYSKTAGATPVVLTPANWRLRARMIG